MVKMCNAICNCMCQVGYCFLPVNYWCQRFLFGIYCQFPVIYWSILSKWPRLQHSHWKESAHVQQMSIEVRSNELTSMVFGQILSYSCTCISLFYNVNVSLPLVLPLLKTLDVNGLFWGILKEETFSKKLMRYVISTSHKG